MPTGYTATLIEKGQTFPQFAATCARAFGEMVMLRDDPLSDQLTEKFEPNDFNSKCLAESIAEVQRLSAMTPEEQEAFGLDLKQQEEARAKEAFDKALKENARLEAMRAEVEKWTPPTSEHQGLYDFMLQQISASMNNLDYPARRIARAEKKTPAEFYTEALSVALRSIEYNREAVNKEIERVNGRNHWVQQLLKSLEALNG